MRHLIAALAAALLLVPSISSGSIKASSQYALDYVCETMKVDCSDMPAPEIRFETWRNGMYGQYRYATPGVVYLNARFFGLNDIRRADPHAISVLIHEVVHLVHMEKIAIVDGVSRLDAWNQPRSRCTSESMAWGIGHTWLLKNGHADKALWKWRTWYGCSKEGYGYVPHIN